MSRPDHHYVRRLAAGLIILGCVTAAACSAASPTSPAAAPAPVSATAAATSATPMSPTSEPAATEPTTTNTLPPPPQPTGPAPSTAGELDAAALPVPAGWRTAKLKGGDEQGFDGNGTWVHARDPRYAAQDVITIGCADVTRDDYTDPTAALEGNLRNRSGEPGVGLALQFADEAAAAHYFTLYIRQVQACTHADDPVRTTLLPGVSGLADRRTYPDGKWTEVGRQVGRRVILIVLSDPGFAITPGQAQRLIDRISG
jgi:hypothetical protein